MSAASRPAARAAVYRLLAISFAPPERLLMDALRTQDFQDTLAACVAAAGDGTVMLPAVAATDAEIEGAYLALFETGPEVALALREGAHVDFICDAELTDADGAAPTLAEDLLRFYHWFGYGLSREPARKLPPDHAVCEFEILSRLCEHEGETTTSPAQVAGCRLAQSDFLQRHLAAWWPGVATRLRAIASAGAVQGFYLALAELALTCLSAHATELSAQHMRADADEESMPSPSTCVDCTGG